MLMVGMQLVFFHRMQPYFAASIEKALKLLLETKHLYQNVKVELPSKEIAQQQMKEMLRGSTPSSGIQESIEAFDVSLSKIEWTVKNPGGRRSLPMIDPSQTTYISIEFVPPTIKLFCPTCKRIEAYNFIYGHDLLEEFAKTKGSSAPENEQVFSLAYQCQSCKSIPEIFLVRRDDLKLVQSGRTPMEEIEVPSFLPKKHKKYFSDAIIAFNSGQTLAGNFLLRAFVEQYVRSLSSSPNTQNIELLFSEYSKPLPDDFKQRFPSLQSIYDKLSDDLHLATASEAVFIQAKADITKHFQARELYEL